MQAGIDSNKIFGVIRMRCDALVCCIYVVHERGRAERFENANAGDSLRTFKHKPLQTHYVSKMVIDATYRYETEENLMEHSAPFTFEKEVRSASTGEDDVEFSFDVEEIQSQQHPEGDWRR